MLRYLPAARRSQPRPAARRVERVTLAGAASRGAAIVRRASLRAPRVRGASHALAACLVLLTSGAAFGHARLTRSAPAADAVLATPPATIELWFNERLDDEFNSVTVYRAAKDGAPADAADLASGPPRVDDADRTHLTAPLGRLAPGAYVVQWKVLSRDGHSARGRVLFRVAGE